MTLCSSTLLWGPSKQSGRERRGAPWAQADSGASGSPARITEGGVARGQPAFVFAIGGHHVELLGVAVSCGAEQDVGA